MIFSVVKSMPRKYIIYVRQYILFYHKVENNRNMQIGNRI